MVRKIRHISVCVCVCVRARARACAVTHHGGTLGDRRYSFHSFLTCALERGEWSVSLAALYPAERAPGTHCTGGWVGPRAGLDAEVRGKILCLCWGSNTGHPVPSQTLYWLSHPSSYTHTHTHLFYRPSKHICCCNKFHFIMCNFGAVFCCQCPLFFSELKCW
jgi:hypothetical protein